MCKPRGGRKLGEGVGEEARKEDQNICFSAAPAGPGAAPLLWEGRLCRLQCRSERFMPCTLNTYRRLSTAQFWKGDYGSDMEEYFIWNCWKISLMERSSTRPPMLMRPCSMWCGSTKGASHGQQIIECTEQLNAVTPFPLGIETAGMMWHPVSRETLQFLQSKPRCSPGWLQQLDNCFS